WGSAVQTRPGPEERRPDQTRTGGKETRPHQDRRRENHIIWRRVGFPGNCWCEEDDEDREAAREQRSLISALLPLYRCDVTPLNRTPHQHHLLVGGAGRMGVVRLSVCLLLLWFCLDPVQSKDKGTKKGKKGKQVYCPS
ncbi:hypothetical protein CRUP_005241, partial [Coryphaenoides rupestris]